MADEMADGSSDRSRALSPARRLEVACLSDVGTTRTENQDFYGEFEDPDANRLLIVADGMGGHRGGATASRLCVQTVGEVFAGGVGLLADRLRYGIELANERVITAATQDPSLHGMGTTAVALVLPPHGPGLVAWVGDSRGYRQRSGRLEAVTHDHSLVAEWVRMGMLREEEAETHPRRNELLRSVGGKDAVDVDVVPVDVQQGDRFLLCSDGLCGYVSDPEIERVLNMESTQGAAQRLIELANAAGGFDNVTVQIAALDLPSASTTRTLDLPKVGETFDRWRFNRLMAGVGTVALLLGVTFWFAFSRGGGGLPEVASAPEEQTALPELEAPPRPAFDADNPFGLSEEELAAERRQARVAVVEPSATDDPEPATDEERGREAAPPPAFVQDRRRAPPLRTPQQPAPTPAPERISVAPEPALVVVAPPPVVEEPSPVVEEPSPVVEEPSPVAVETATAETEPVAGAPEPVVATQKRVDLRSEIERFLEGWRRTVVEKDVAGYRDLGFSISDAQFERSYGRRDGLTLSFVHLDHVEPTPGIVNVRVRMTYGFVDRTGPHRTEKERKIVLRQTDDRLSYAGTWE